MEKYWMEYGEGGVVVVGGCGFCGGWCVLSKTIVTSTTTTTTISTTIIMYTVYICIVYIENI